MKEEEQRAKLVDKYKMDTNEVRDSFLKVIVEQEKRDDPNPRYTYEI